MAGGGAMGLHGVKAVFFDLDNTLIDTAAAGRRAIEEVLPLSPFQRGPAAPGPAVAVPPCPAADRAGGRSRERPDPRPPVPCR